jgi:microcystin-dependent protein
MAQAYISEIRIFAFPFAPKYWALCNGQTLAISQNQALFSLLGTTFGGNGTTTFQLPNLQGRVPMHWGNYIGGGNYTLGQNGGQEAHTLTIPEMPQHLHQVIASTVDATDGAPSPTLLWAKGASQNAFSTAADSYQNPAAIKTAGSNQPHENRAPYLTVNFCICLNGIFPSRN